jgi:hypothetical protein
MSGTGVVRKGEVGMGSGEHLPLISHACTTEERITYYDKLRQEEKIT